jgi:hypothetical protein
MSNLLPNEHVVSLISLNQGAAVEMFDNALKKVLDNIADPNVDPETTRQISLVVKFAPAKNSKSAAVSIECGTKLAAQKPAGTTVFFGKVEGELKAVEADPNQGLLFDESATKSKLQ